MHLIIDPLVFAINPHRGIARIYREMLPILPDLDPSVAISLMGRHTIKELLPYPHASSVMENMRLRPRRLFSYLAKASERRQIDRRINTVGQAPVWHSTYYTPAPDWIRASIVFVYDMIHERFPDLFCTDYDDDFRARKAMVMRQADHIISISHTTAEDVHHLLGIERSRISVAYLAASATFSDASQSRQFASRPYILYVGDRGHYKGFVNFVTAYATWNLRKQVRLLVVGRPWSRSETDWLRMHRCLNDVEHAEATSDMQLREFYSNAEAFVCPSLWEGFGIPLLEAMACGCPIAASDIPSTREIAGDYPLYFQPACHDTIHTALSAAIESRGRMAEWAAQRVTQFSWRQTAEVFLGACRTITH